MELESLHVNQESYGPRKGEYTGTCKFKGQHGTVEIMLDHAFSSSLLKLVADSVVRASKDLAQNLTAETFAHIGGQIEDKS